MTRRRPGTTVGRHSPALLLGLLLVGVALLDVTPGVPSAAAVSPPAPGAASLLAGPANGSGVAFTFTETGLPNGTLWTVATWEFGSGAANPVATSSNATAIVVPMTNGSVAQSFSVWAVPGTSGMVYVGTPDRTGPLASNVSQTINVSFAAVPLAGGSFPVTVVESGLPAGLPWSAIFVRSNGTVNAGFAGPSRAWTLPTGDDFTLVVSPIYGPNGSGFNSSAVEVLPETVGGNWTNATAPGGSSAIVVGGPTLVRVDFQVIYRLTVVGTPGGSFSPSSRWVVPGTPVTLSATPGPGYLFGSWDGSGPGAVVSYSPTVTLVPLGPVSMVATFTPIFYYVVVYGPAGVPFSLFVGGSLYSTTNGTIYLPGLYANNYTVSVPYYYVNGSGLERTVGTSVSSTSFSYSSAGYRIDHNGSFTVTLKTQYALSIAVEGAGGSTDPVAGTYWEDAGSEVAITSTPLPGASLQEWAGTGSGSVSTRNASFLVTMDGPITEVARFGAPLPPVQYTIALTASDLPAGASWSATVGSIGATSTTDTLDLEGIAPGGRTLVVYPATTGAAGVEYAPEPNGTFAIDVEGNVSLGVIFSLEYRVHTVVGAGGSIDPVPDWVPAGTELTFSASAPLVGFTFAGWVGTVSSGAATFSVNVTGPLNETAEFLPTIGPPTSGAVDLKLVGLLVVGGAAVGFVAALGLRALRRRARRDA
ncbi:MAG TPA: hypothetical protein VMH78_08090 [Thermoplasmata archaeon]|nr:hypothetical protein [Thermoplasmata archaeon]